MSQPLFSVTITTYNRADVLPRALESVLSQGFRDFEVIVVDDGSSDNTRDIVARYDDFRLQYVLQQNSGASAARNRGVASATGTYVTFLDDDDEALPNWLAGLSHLIDTPQPAVLSCGMLFVDDLGNALRELRPKPLRRAMPGTKVLFRTGSFAVRRDVFNAVGGYAPGAVRSTNSEFSLRLVAFCIEQELGVSHTSEMLLRAYRHHPQPGYYEGKLIGAEYMLSQHPALFEKSPKKYATYLSVAGVNAARVGDFKKARRYFARSITVRPTAGVNYPHLLISLCPPFAKRFWGARAKRRLSQATPVPTSKDPS